MAKYTFSISYRSRKLRSIIKVLLAVIIVNALWSILISTSKHSDIANSEEDMNTFLNKMSERTQRIHDICNLKCSIGKCQTLHASHVWLLKNEHVAYCPIYKSATSTWRDHLINLLNRTNPWNAPKYKINGFNKKVPIQTQVKLIHLGAINPKNHDFVDYINNLPEKHDITGFIVVRHPFERLISAYRDKLERNNLLEPYYYKTYGKYFVQKYRKAAIKTLGESYFGEENNFGTPVKVLDDRRPNADLPSFWEFAQSVIDRYRMDEHWQPINEYCSVCNVISMKAFRYILKFEQLKTEENLFLSHVKWNVNNEKLGSKLNVNKPDAISGHELTLLYFSSLSEQQIKQLYKVYELDFLLFDYKFDIGDLHFPN